ncbi:MAG: dicarboxylate/amino acid:cation symporter [Polyangiaceae bacterium]|nr:dicarboxylate/amino acid:cation symporter [Polyangiaceae bacterium]
MSNTSGDGSPAASTGPWRWLVTTPLFVRILFGLVFGVVIGVLLGPDARSFDTPAKLILRLLGALAPALILVAVVRAIMTAEIHGRLAFRLVRLLLLNTLVAILVGLGVANLIRPGEGVALPAPARVAPLKTDIMAQILDNVPDSLVRPFVENKVIAVVFIALLFGVAARGLHGSQRRVAEDLIGLAFSCIVRVLHWVIALVPLAVLGKVASIVGTAGFEPFLRLGMFVLAVLVALAVQAAYYLVRVRLGSWVRPFALLSQMSDALVMAFSTASSTITMPLTYERLRTRVGLRERSASLGALVGANFNNDGTALYEAMSALFVAQLIGVQLSFPEQLMVIATSVVASVGAAGIPEAGLVTMTLVFSAVGLPVEYIALLLTVDWFLDRCRTMINVLGDTNVACLLDGKIRSVEPAASS